MWQEWAWLQVSPAGGGPGGTGLLPREAAETGQLRRTSPLSPAATRPGHPHQQERGRPAAQRPDPCESPPSPSPSLSLYTSPSPSQSAPLRDFLLTNLHLDEETGRLRWKANLEVLQRMFPHLSSFPDMGGAFYDGPTLFLGGGNSDIIG